MSQEGPFPARDAMEEALVRLVLDPGGRPEDDAASRLASQSATFAAELQELQRVFSLLGYAACADPPRDLRHRVVAAARKPERQARSSTRLLWPGLAAAASIAAVLLFASNSGLRRELALQKDVSLLLRQPNVVLTFEMKGTSGSAAGSVVLDLDAKKGAVVIRGLDPLPPEQVYRLWALVAGQKVPCGQFNASAEGAVQTLFPVPVDAYTAPVTTLILTVEPSSTPAQPLGPTVMVGSLAS